MKVFKFTHMIYNTVSYCKESELPAWLTHKSNKWFLEKHVLTLEVDGITVQSEHNIIERIA